MNKPRFTDFEKFESQVWQILSQVKSLSKTGWVEDRYFIDWIGNIWDRNSFPYIPLDALPTELPWESDSFRAGKLEWVGFGFGLLASLQNPNSKGLIIELGSSQAPWCLSWVRANEILRPGRGTLAIGVEAGAKKNQIETFWREQKLTGRIENQLTRIGDLNFHVNYLNKHDNVKFLMLHAAVTYRKKEAIYFPDIDISRDNGAGISLEIQKKTIEDFPFNTEK
jgi:hypothetical protein